MEMFTNEDLDVLTNQDILDTFNIIRIASNNLSLSDMRLSIARALKAAFHADGVVFFAGDREGSAIDNSNIVGVNWDTNYLDRWIGYYSYRDPFQNEGCDGKRVYKVDDILSYRRWVNTRIYKDFYLPQNIHYKLSLSLRSESKVLGLVGLFRPKERQDFSEGDMAKARILPPYLTTALENINIFSEMEEAKSLFGECVKNLPFLGVIVLNESLQPIYINSGAREICANMPRGVPVKMGRGGAPSPALIPSEIIEDCEALRGVSPSGTEPALSRRHRCIDGGGGRKILAVTSVPEPVLQSEAGCRFMIYLVDSSEVSKSKDGALREKYRITKREAEIIGCVCQGLANDEIADKLCISRFTVETHLKKVFDKTGVKSRTCLAALLQAL